MGWGRLICEPVQLGASLTVLARIFGSGRTDVGPLSTDVTFRLILYNRMAVLSKVWKGGVYS